MEKLEEALREALFRNADETSRWSKYRDEQETAITNLKQFAEKLSIDVMVPVGSKAIIPGQLYHTNEILVSHNSGFFSKCSSKQAQELAKKRISMAEERLESLKKEQEMYQNKLEKPLIDGALPNDEQREIIENYDEEAEKKWRVEHQIRVREEKLREAKESADAKKEKNHQDVMNLLDDLEMMDELEQELDTLQVEDDEILTKLISGEIQLPTEKTRVSHYYSKSIIIGSDATEKETNIEPEVFTIDTIPELLSSCNISKSSGGSVDFTNNNTQPNSVDYGSDEESRSTSSGDLPQLLLDIEDESKQLYPDEKLKFFKKKVKEITKELQNLKVQSINDISEKLNKIEVRDYLYDYIEILRDEIENKLFEKNKKQVKHPVEEKKTKRISFAKADEVQFIDKNKAANTVTRSKIELSDDSYSMLNLKSPKTPEAPSFAIGAQLSTPQSPVINKRDVILQKVENSLTNQSRNYFNLIDEIIESTSSSTRTMRINVSHSNKHFMHPGCETASNKGNTIGCPADIYETYKHVFPIELQSKITSSPDVSSQREEKIIEIPSSTAHTSHVGNKKDVKTVSDDNRRIDKVKEEQYIKGNKEKYKSILKNRDTVQQEERNVNRDAKPAKTNRKKTNESEDVGYKLIIGDVVENAKITDTFLEKNAVMKTEMNEPDPLPDGKFVNAVSPKKRISRFKQMRTNT